MGECIVQLELGVWLAAVEGDPGRTLVMEKAERFETLGAAAKALTAARKYRPFESATIDADHDEGE